MSIRTYSTSKAAELKAKQQEDEWSKILKADYEKKMNIERERKLSLLNQQRNLKDFLKLQVEEKKRQEELEKNNRHHDLIVNLLMNHSLIIGVGWHSTK